MKIYIIMIAAVMCIMTIGGCSGTYADKGISGSTAQGNVNITTAAAKITVNDGCEVSERSGQTDAALALREWIEGFETEPVASVPEDGRLYTIELTFGGNAPDIYRYLDCGGACYLCRRDEWFSVGNPKPIPVGFVSDLGIDAWDIVKVEYAHNAQTAELELSVEDKTALSEWLGGVEYRHRWFPEGETPGDSDGGEAFTFTFADGELSYINNGASERYLLCGGEWYDINGCKEFPIKNYE